MGIVSERTSHGSKGEIEKEIEQSTYTCTAYARVEISQSDHVKYYVAENIVKEF